MVDTDFVTACSDLEEVLLTLQRFESVLSYKRRLNRFNCTLDNCGGQNIKRFYVPMLWYSLINFNLLITEHKYRGKKMSYAN